MRGKVYSLTRFSSCSRITPAYAGKSSSTRHNFFPCWDHPRLCGEKCFVAGFLLGGVRITPAYAGKRSCWSLGTCRRGDHPRLCGEKRTERSFFALWHGSPPPMRGKENKMKKYDLASRITPAYAGKRKKACPAPEAARDHPRLCGEKVPAGSV